MIQKLRESYTNTNSDKWLEVMNFEIKFMHTNQVWIFVNLLEEIVLIGCKRVFKRKISKDGHVKT